MIEPVEKQNISDVVYYKMLNMIVEGQWQQGSMIPSENELREAFSVSRDTVRQAVHRLSALGILRSRQGKGTYVEKIDTGFYLNLLVPAVFLDEGDSISILEFMKSIQVESVRIVCQRATDKEISALADYLSRMKIANDYNSYFEYDMGYHNYLVQLTGNHLFIKSVEIVERMLHVYLRDIVAFHGSGMSIQQHENCFHALQEHNVDKAVGIMVEHYDMLLSRMRTWLAMSIDERSLIMHSKT
jgi:GntR family transcriptional repressor for pyruvate dehydrogenase complex